LRRACFQSLRRHIFTGLFTGEEFSDWSTTIVVMAAFDSAQPASLRSLTEVFGAQLAQMSYIGDEVVAEVEVDIVPPPPKCVEK
jgi:hypothetical protein